MESYTLSTAEKQLISTLHWFRSRYALYLGLEQDRIADRTSILSFGREWIGKAQLDWVDTYEPLISKGIIQFSDGQYSFTEKGEIVKMEVEAETPFYRYEYDNFFSQAKLSKAHQTFCRKVYGLDLTQHGLADQEELQHVIRALTEIKPKRILDLGCGNGQITHYLSQVVQGHFMGIDISEKGIGQAKKLEHQLLSFQTGNMNDLQDELGTFDVILSVDTLYYAQQLDDLIPRLKDRLQANGKILVYFSQWIMDSSYDDYLDVKQTKLARILNECSLEYDAIDLRISGLRHWKTKLQVLEEMKTEFEQEGNASLWDYRYREAYRYANWGDNLYTRYFYIIHT